MAGPNSTTRVQGASLETEGRRRTINPTVSATLVDATPRYLPDSRDSTLDGLIHGLKALNPALEQYAKGREEEDAAKGTRQAATGQEIDDNASLAQANAFLGIRGMQGAQEDLASFIDAYQTQFDKDKGDFEAFHRDFFASKTQGLTNGAYSAAYAKTIAPGIEKVRGDLAKYRTEAHVAAVESTLLQLTDTGIKSAVAAGQPINQDYIASLRGEAAKLNVSQDRFNELLFDSLKRHADEGNFGVFNALKENNPDGTPGLYFDPRWKAKIDAAEVHAQNVFLTKRKQAEEAAKRDREDRQDVAMLEVMKMAADGDTTGARALFQKHVDAGLFTRGSEFMRWDDRLRKAENREARGDQLERENNLQIAILEGKAGIREIIAADVTPKQRNSLIGVLERRKESARADARAERAAQAAAANAETGIYKTPIYKQHKDLLEGSLWPTDSGLYMDDGARGRVKQERAGALAEFAMRAGRAKPEELPGIAEDIRRRVTGRINEVAQAGAQPIQSRFRNQRELALAYQAGGVTDAELEAGRRTLPKAGGATPTPAQPTKGK